ncbi:MAG: hypothetical protein Q8K26_00380, partial [Candidatus Gracilibacteria bacterium]|nr:hypothetical protein [Candidatus Gracilibacteria bacterium]
TQINTLIESGRSAEDANIQKSSLVPSGMILSDVSIANLGELISKSEKFSDTEAVRVFKNANVTISGDMNLTGVRTIIIENGNLFINADITYADKDASFAWVVKNGNIVVHHSVSNIAGVYVTLAGSIKSNGTAVPDRLSVDGSLYGDTSDLVNNRSYVRGEMDYTALNVGVVINYSNRALKSPPPFLSRFIEQYTLQKVAR